MHVPVVVCSLVVISHYDKIVGLYEYNTSIHILNRTVESRSEKTPFEQFSKQKRSIENFRVLGCRAYFHVPSELRKKLDAKAQPGWFVGYPENTKGWIIWEQISRKFITSRDDIFDEELLITDCKEETK